MIGRREAALAAILVALVLAVGLRAPEFLSPASLVGALADTGPLVMLALAQTCVILTRGIDLSAASNLALTGM
ncbi:MAG: ABC transporter permease, partial [Hyphomicrobiales bacterium]|nr:ABC transporter permease [Hyphomicrobiales bacterium]